MLGWVPRATNGTFRESSGRLAGRARMCTEVRNFVRVPSERYDFKPSHGSEMRPDEDGENVSLNTHLKSAEGRFGPHFRGCLPTE